MGPGRSKNLEENLKFGALMRGGGSTTAPRLLGTYSLADGRGFSYVYVRVNYFVQDWRI